jgi:hypothetical protein
LGELPGTSAANMFEIIFSLFYSIRQGLRGRATLHTEILALRPSALGCASPKLQLRRKTKHFSAGLNVIIAATEHTDFGAQETITYSAVSHHIVSEGQQTAPGILIAHETASHDQYRFAFTVGGQKYDELGTTDKEKLEIGKKVLVYYNPRSP